MALPDFEAWAVFAKIAEAGSFAGAADDLGLSKATVSKALARLEARLGTRLFHRTSRRLSLTETGRELRERAAEVLGRAEAVEADALSQAQSPRGKVRLALPMSFGLSEVAPLLPDFLMTYPDLSIDLNLSDRQVDLVGEGYDMALRIAALEDSSLRARRLCRVDRFLVASPAYVAKHGAPVHPAELTGHRCLGYAHLPSPGTWRFRHVSGEEAMVRPDGPLSANNGDALQPAVAAGLGLAVQPDFVVAADLKSGRLITVMQDWSPPPVALHIVTPPGQRPAKVEVLIDFFARCLSDKARAESLSVGRAAIPREAPQANYSRPDPTAAPGSGPA